MTVEVRGASFNLEIVEANKPKITRQLEFSNGDTVTFSITVENDGSATLPQLHQASVRELIRRLEEWVAPQP